MTVCVRVREGEREEGRGKQRGGKVERREHVQEHTAFVKLDYALGPFSL